jgi:hypothetical protein
MPPSKKVLLRRPSDRDSPGYEGFCSVFFLPLFRLRGTIGTGMVLRIGVTVGLPM